MTKREFIEKVAYQPITHFFDGAEREAMAKAVLETGTVTDTLGKIMLAMEVGRILAVKKLKLSE